MRSHTVMTLTLTEWQERYCSKQRALATLFRTQAWISSGLIVSQPPHARSGHISRSGTGGPDQTIQGALFVAKQSIVPHDGHPPIKQKAG
jgi:hypothetical protein